jgi:hypothetical protein
MLLQAHTTLTVLPSMHSLYALMASLHLALPSSPSLKMISAAGRGACDGRLAVAVQRRSCLAGPGPPQASHD